MAGIIQRSSDELIERPAKGALALLPAAGRLRREAADWYADTMPHRAPVAVETPLPPGH